MIKHNIMFVPDFLFKSSGNYNNGLIEFLDSAVSSAMENDLTETDPGGNPILGSNYSVFTIYYNDIIGKYEHLVKTGKTDINRFISRSDLLQLCQLDATIKSMLNLERFIPVMLVKEFTNTQVLSMFTSPAEESTSVVDDSDQYTSHLLNPSQLLTEIILSNTGKPYDLYVRSNTIFVIVKTGFANLLVTHRKVFSLFLLGELVRQFRQMFGTTKTYGTSLFKVFMLNQEPL